MGSLIFDVRHALRSLVKAPVFTAVTVLTLALGIGANSAIFSLVNAALLRPLGYQRPEELMMIHEVIPESKVPRFGVSPVDYLDFVQYQRSFGAIGVYRTRPYELSETGVPEQITVAQVSSSMFAILGVAPLRGQGLSIEDDSVDRSVVVISDRFAQRHFAGRDAIGARVVFEPPSIHRCRRDARLVRIPQARRGVQRRAGRRLSAAAVYAGGAAGPWHVLQPQRRRTAAERRVGQTGGRGHRGARAAGSRKLSAGDAGDAAGRCRSSRRHFSTSWPDRFADRC